MPGEGPASGQSQYQTLSANYQLGGCRQSSRSLGTSSTKWGKQLVVQIRKGSSESEGGTLHKYSETTGINQNAPGQTVTCRYPVE